MDVVDEVDEVDTAGAAPADAAPAGGTPCRPWPGRLRRLLVWFFACLSLVCVLYVFRVPLLRGAAWLWIINEPVRQSDAIVVLGGSMNTRPFEAARLYRGGMAPRVLIMNVRSSDTETLGITRAEAEIEREILLKNGVPAGAISAIGDGVMSTRDESLAVKKWAAENHPAVIIITTDMFHTRRVRWLFRKTLRDAGVTVIVHPAPVRDYTASDWWLHEDGLVAFQNEIIKYAYYRIRY